MEVINSACDYIEEK